MEVGIISSFALYAGNIEASNVIAEYVGGAGGGFGEVSLSSLTIYDPSTNTTGTFRYSTLTTLFALPDTSLLYFNDLVLAGAYVWPGQTISALNWTSGCNGVQLVPAGYPGSKFSNTNNIGGCNWSLVSNISGGSPPYFINDLNNMSTAINLRVIDSGGSIGLLNHLTGFLSNMPSNGFNGTCNFNFTLRDSSTPIFTRSLRLII